MKTKRQKKNVILKRMAAGMLAGAMLLGSTGTAFAADYEQLSKDAKAAYQEGNYETAKEYYQELLQTGDAGASDLWYAGQVEQALGFYYKANEFQDKAYAKFTTSHNPKAVYEQKIRNMYLAGKYWYVEKYYNEAAEKGLVTGFMNDYYADSLIRCNQNEKAIEIYQENIDKFSDGNGTYIASYLNKIGDCQKRLGKTDEASNSYSEAREYDYNQELYEEKLAALYLEYKLFDVNFIITEYMSGKTKKEIADTLTQYEYYEDALRYYEMAENESGEDLRTSKADTYNEMGLPKEAAALYEEFILENPEDTEAMNRLGAIYCDNLGRFDEAKEMFEKALALNSDATGTQGNLAVVARKTGNFEEIPGIYQKVIDMKEDYLAPYRYKVTYQKDITVEDAIAILSEYPGWPETTEMQALILSDTINTGYMTETTLNSYLAYFEERVAEDSDNYYYLQPLASILVELGRYEEALSYYEKAHYVAGILTYYANNGLGNCYSAMQNYEMAAMHYNENAEAGYRIASRLSAANSYISAGKYDDARAKVNEYFADGGTDTDDAIYVEMLIAYQEDNYELVLQYADEYLVKYPNHLKTKAYKAAALTALGMEGADEIIADIDSIGYTYEDTNVLIVESILGRFDKARECYQFLSDNWPGNAREVLFDYELRNLRKDPEFCKMAGLEPPVVENSGENATEMAISPLLVVAGTGIVAVLVGVVAVLVKRRKKNTEN